MLAVAVIALAGVFPTAAQGAHPERGSGTLELGVADYGQYGPPRVRRLLEAATDLRMSFVRLTMEWSPGETAIAATQRQILLVASRFPKLRVIFTLSFDHGRDAPTTEGARRDFVAWAKDMVRNGAVDVEATNEPMQPLFWSTSDPAPEYAALLEELYPALHRVDPSVNVIAGSLARHHAVPFMAQLTKALAGRKVADAVSVHYPASRQDYLRRVGLLHRCFGSALPVYVTEDGSTLSVAAQRLDLASKIELARRENAVAWILLQLQNRPDLLPWHTGLYERDWAPEPAYYAVRRESVDRARSS
jgi:hypothetical protein